MSKTVIFAEGTILDDIVGLGVEAGILTKELTTENRKRFRLHLIEVMQRHGCTPEKYSELTPGTGKGTGNYVQKVLSGTEFEGETARWAAREVAYDCLMKSPKKMVCICPEMKSGSYMAESGGGKTDSGWGYREGERKAGKDVPIGGCICHFDDNAIKLIIDELIMVPSS